MKQKTKSALKKRIRRTGGGKLMRFLACNGHLKSSKSKKTLRNKRNGSEVPQGHKKMIQRMLGGNM